MHDTEKQKRKELEMMRNNIQKLLNKYLNTATVGLFILSVLILVWIFFLAPTTYYVSPSGNDSNSGTSSDSPLKTIQKAVDLAQPGDTIKLSSGQYLQDIVSKRNATASNPITIEGSPDAVIKGAGSSRVIEINHDYHTLKGFTVDGLFGNPTQASGYRDKLIYVLGKEARNGVEGLKLTNMTVKNAGGECMRLRYFATKAEIAYNTITNCGVHDFVFKAGGKNGEGIYIGTSNNQWADGKNPTPDPDETRDNVIHDNYIDTQGNECVDIKEGAMANIVESNICRGQKDSESGGFDSRGNGNIFRHNDVRGSSGAGIRFGGALIGSTQYGKNNDAYGNTIADNKNGGVKFQATPQGDVCGNTMSGNAGGNSVGAFAAEFDPAKLCLDASLTNISSPTPTPTPSAAPDSNGSKNTADARNSSLVKSSNLIAYSNNFSSGYGPKKLWDGCYEEDSYSSQSCTTGGKNAASFWVEFDFKRTYDLSQIRLYGDAEGEWVSKKWAVRYKNRSFDSWSELFSEKDAFLSGWLTEDININARYVQVEVIGDNINFSPGRTQARELEIYGTESLAATTSESIVSTTDVLHSSGNGGGSGGGGGGGGGGTNYVVSSSQSQNAVALPAFQEKLANANPVQIKLFRKNLNVGTYDSDVSSLQEFLSQDKNIYPEGLITGYFGSLTKKAVQRFQCKYGVVCSDEMPGFGTVGPKTLAKLNELNSQQINSRQAGLSASAKSQGFRQKIIFGERNSAVKSLQEFLSQDKNIYPEGLITGYFGSLTKKAVQRFQCKYSIVCGGDEKTTGYGNIGPKTLATLNGAR